MKPSIDLTKQMDPELVSIFRAMEPRTLAAQLRDPSTWRGDEAQSPLPPSEPDSRVRRRDVMVAGPPGAPDVSVRLYEPHDRGDLLPAVLYVHGGGFVRGSVGWFDFFCEQMVVSVDLLVASVEYRLAPAHPFPAGPEDCYSALLWLFESAGELGIDATRIGIVGASAGGGIAAGVALMARDRGQVQLGYQMCLCACLDDRHTTSSTHQITDARTWNRETSLECWRAYLGDQADVSPYAAPARMEDVSGLPPSYLAVGQLDLTRDENVAYAARLIEAGVPTELHVYPGAFHGFDLGFAPDARVANDAIEDRHAALRRALHPRGGLP